MNADQAKKLREPFDPKLIGHLPRAGITLDFVGHAATCDRLLQVDPAWTWEPMARDTTGAPVLVTDRGLFSDQTAKVGLWMRVLVADVWTPGFGEGKNAKEAISDGIRNAAMRRGVALDLWSKEDLHASAETAPAKSAGAAKPAVQPPAAAGTGNNGAAGAQSSAAPADTSTFTTPAGREATKAQKKILTDLFTSLGSAGTITEDQFVKAARGQGAIGDGFAACIESLSMMGATDLIARLRNLEKNSAGIKAA